MSNIFYAHRKAKDGNTLITSYNSRVSAEKYGGEGATITSERLFMELKDDSKHCTVSAIAKGPLVRGFMKNNGEISTEESRPFGIWGKDPVTQEWNFTGLRFNTIGAANSSMKALIQDYSALIITEDDKPIKKTASEGPTEKFEGIVI